MGPRSCKQCKFYLSIDTSFAVDEKSWVKTNNLKLKVSVVFLFVDVMFCLAFWGEMLFILFAVCMLFA